MWRSVLGRTAARRTVGNAARIACAVLVVAALVPAAAADEGMWLLNRPPNKLLKERYGFEASPQWLEHLQRSCVRIGAGGSGSIVSGDGLVMTNHHVGSDALERLSTTERNLLKTGFYAARLEDELKCEGEEFEVLVSIEDVTARVAGAAAADMTPAAANEARRRMMTTLEQESQERTGLKSEVVTLYHGARYHLYRYQRYTDIRLVMAPEEQIAFFGGDTDNFEYPRFDLDMCFFRIYENGRPLKPEHYLSWCAAGAADGELTFVLGHPARTQRMYTMDHLRFLRDVEIPSILRKLWRREVQLQTFSARGDENARIANGDRRSVENSRKAFTGILAGLHDPAVMRDKASAESALRAAAASVPQHGKQTSAAWDRLSAAYRDYATYYERFAALEGRRSVMRSDLLNISRHLVRMAEEKTRPNAERLREYTESELKSRELEVFSPAPIYDELEVDRIASGLAFLAERFGGDDPLVTKLLAGRSPHERARELVGVAGGPATSLKDVEARRRLAAGGTEAVASSKDPLIAFQRLLDPEARKLRKRFEDEVESVEREAYARIAAARFALEGEDGYPDATFTLRLSFGSIRGYQEDGRTVPPFTDFAGLYQRSAARHAKPPFDLPPRWVERRDRLKLDTPFNFVCTADIIGGNSGSPVVNRKGEVIGLIFDGNIHGLVWDVAYTDRQGRAVAVDARGIIEALRKVYDADALADELLRGRR